MTQEQNTEKKPPTESFAEMFKTFGQALSEVFNDPELKQKALTRTNQLILMRA